MSQILFCSKPITTQPNAGREGKSNKGILIIEVLISITIIAIALVSLLSLAVLSLRISSLTEKTLQAKNLAQETVEAVRSFRDRTDWDVNGLASLSAGSGNLYYPELNAVPEWMIIPGVETINGFMRKIVFEEISPNSRKVIVTVSWEDKEVEIITYFTNWR